MIPDIPKEIRKEVYDKLQQKFNDACTSYNQAKLYYEWCGKRKKDKQKELLDFIEKYGKYDG